MLRKIITFIVIIASLIIVLYIFSDTKKIYENQVSLETQSFLYNKVADYEDIIQNYYEKKKLNSSNNDDNQTNNNFTQNLEILAVPKFEFYTIKPGDTLISIANIFNQDYKKLGKINNIKNLNLIYAWDVLKIPK